MSASTRRRKRRGEIKIQVWDLEGNSWSLETIRSLDAAGFAQQLSDVIGRLEREMLHAVKRGGEGGEG